MSASLDDYLELITSEHSDRPSYVATVSLSVQPYVDGQSVLAELPEIFDVDVAVGQQLDFTGQWVGRTRNIQLPLNIFFSLDTPGLGLDEGVWYTPFAATTGTYALPDYQYRILLKATIAANYWDGTIPGAYEAWDTLLGPLGFGILIQDTPNMEITVVLIGEQPDPITRALFTTGELDLKAGGVTLNHALPTVYPAGVVNGVAGTPIFGLDVENGNVAGLDVGAWAEVISTE